MIAARSSRRLRRWLVGITAMVLVSLLAPAGVAQAADGPVPVPPETGMTEQGRRRGHRRRPGLRGQGPARRSLGDPGRQHGPGEVRRPEGSRRSARRSPQQHVVLDELDVAAAKKLGIALPNEPNADQRGWLAEMQAANATTFDQIFIDRLRAAHGKIFPAIGDIRSSTRNDAVRKLAQQSNQFVMTHMTLLESSGLVDYGSLPTAPPPAAANAGPVPVDGQMLAAATGTGGVPGVNTSVILLVLAAPWSPA